MKNSVLLKIVCAAILCLVSISASVLGQNDVPRRTTAITYPLDDIVTVQFRGTTRFPRMKGEARIRRTSRNGTEIELSVSKMPRPFELGAGYSTYVLWAISPDGQVDNLGEIKRRGFFEFDSKISVTTRLQTFALIITAEPHFLVSRPSQEIMLENLSPVSASGKVIATLPSIQYFGNSSDYFRDSRTPEIAEVDYAKTPSAILQAKQAIALARFAGADRDAAEELKEAESLYLNADASWKAGRDEELVDIAARKAVSAAVKAEANAAVRRDAREKRNEKLRADAETRQAENRFTNAQNQITELQTQLATETRNRELSERDAINYSSQVRELRDENGRLREEVGRLKVELDAAKTRIAAVETQQKAADEQKARDERLNTLRSNQSALVASMKRFGTVAEDGGSIIVTLPEVIWSGVRASTLSSAADARLSGIARLISENPDYRVTVESYLDDRGSPEELQTITQERAVAISERLALAGIASQRIETKGFGGTVTVVPNTTVANRARNRRVRIVLTPNL